MSDTACVAGTEAADGEELTAPEIAYLRVGPREAIRTGLAMLHVRGHIHHGGAWIGRSGAPPADVEGPERTLYDALREVVWVQSVASHESVQRAMADLRERLIRRKLLRRPWRRWVIPPSLVVAPPFLLGRFADLDAQSAPLALLAAVALAAAAPWFVPRRTFAGARALRRLRQRHPGPPDPAPAAGRRRPRISPEEAGLAVALFGDRGLAATVPQFARHAGLLDSRR